jgi:hypothetical protein
MDDNGEEANMTTARRFAFAAVAALSLTACQSVGSSRISMEPESEVLSRSMHPTIRTAFEADFIEVIVKGTSAEALARACASQIRVVPAYRSSLSSVLRSNDVEFGRGTSRKEVAQKVVEHRQLRNCGALADRLNAGGYKNLFLERV